MDYRELDGKISVVLAFVSPNAERFGFRLKISRKFIA